MSDENKGVSLPSLEEPKQIKEKKETPNVEVDSSIVEGGYDMDFSDLEDGLVQNSTPLKVITTETIEAPVEESVAEIEQVPVTDVNDKLMDALVDEIIEEKENNLHEKKSKKKSIVTEKKPKEEKEKKTEDNDIILESELKNSESSPEAIVKDLDDEDLTEKEKEAQKELEALDKEAEEVTEELGNLYQEQRNATFESNVADDLDVKNDIVLEEKGKKVKISKKEDEEIEQKIKDHQERLEKIAKRATEITEKLNYYGAELEGSFAPFVSSQNKILKNFAKRNIPAEKIQTTTKANDPENEELFVKQYITQETASSSPVVAPRITRVPLILSGYYAELKNFTYTEMADYARKLQEAGITFKEKLIREIDAVYNHIVWTSFMKKGQLLDYDEFLRRTKFADYTQLHFGMYDASFPGVTTWNIRCSKCRNEFPIQRTSKQLCYLLNNRNDSVLNDKFLHDILLQKVPVDQMKNTRIYQFANSLWSEKVIYPNNIKVGYETPSLIDVLETLDIIEESYSTDFPDTADIMDPNKDNYTILLLLTSIHKLWVPLVAGQDDNGKNIIRFHELDATVKGNTEQDVEERQKARRYIIATLMNLPEEQFAELFTGREVRLRVKAEGIRHFVNNVTCPNCNSRIGNIPIDMRDSFFGRTTEIARSTNLMM